jgi:FkbM family methyltransferase
VKLFLDGISFALHDILFENFFGGAYEDLDVNNRIVVDVGAGVGDTAIYFTIRGAKKVIALEPYPAFYEIASKNLELNKVDNKVKMINGGLSGSDSYECADYSIPKGYLDFRSGEKCSVRVRMCTLKTLAEEMALEEAVLKMDCEGCEYDVFKNIDTRTLRKFNQIVIEFHNGSDPIANVLREAGFRIKIMPIRSSDVPVEKTRLHCSIDSLEKKML